MSKERDEDITTRLIHHPYVPPDNFAAPQVGVHKASTVYFQNVARVYDLAWESRQGYTYGLHGTPTTLTLEERLCTLEGGLHCTLLPSGLAAIANVALALLRSGDEVLIPDNAYGPNKVLAGHELQAFGIAHRFYDQQNPADLQEKITDRTRLVWLEAPGSVTMEFPDLPELVRICRRHGVTSALDNTWGAGLAFCAFDLGRDDDGDALGADLSIQALTKYPSGGGDVLMGSVITRDDELNHRIKSTHSRMGWGVGANDADTILRALPTLPLRYHAQGQTALALAQWFATRPEIAQVLHPALPCSPGHEHWQALCGEAAGMAGLFSVVFSAEYSRARVHAFCDALRLFRIGYSWGGPVSLVMPYDVQGMRSPGVSRWPYKGTLARFSTGFEAAADLQADLETALRHIR